MKGFMKSKKGGTLHASIFKTGASSQYSRCGKVPTIYRYFRCCVAHSTAAASARIATAVIHQDRQSRCPEPSGQSKRQIAHPLRLFLKPIEQDPVAYAGGIA